MAILVSGAKGWRLSWRLLILVLVATPAFALSYFTALEPTLIQRLAARFGAEASPRLGYWREQFAARRRHEMSDRQRMELANRMANNIPYADDLAHWGVAEYWATPAEFVASDGGDCDDYAITKYFSLIELGMAAEKLRITYVRALSAREITHHMVLAYYVQPDAEPLILDNLVDEILPAGHRLDLLPVLSFNDAETWAGHGTKARKVSSSAVRQWNELRQRMAKEGVQ